MSNPANYFQPGNQIRKGKPNPGTGRPPSLKRKLLELVQEAVSIEDQRELLQKTKGLALAGDLNAIKFIFDTIYGKPHTNSAPSEELLSTARAELALQQIASNIFLFQAQFLKAQAEGKAVENTMWRQQFVTEEEQQEKITTLVKVLNDPLLKLTPEEAMEKFGLSSEALERLKAHCGQSQAKIIRKVLTDSSEEDEEEDSESDEEESDEN